MLLKADETTKKLRQGDVHERPAANISDVEVCSHRACDRDHS